MREAGAGSVNLGPRLPGIGVSVDVGEACRSHLGWLDFRLEETVLRVASQVWAVVGRTRYVCRMVAVGGPGCSNTGCKSSSNAHRDCSTVVKMKG